MLDELRPVVTAQNKGVIHYHRKCFLSHQQQYLNNFQLSMSVFYVIHFWNVICTCILFD